MRHHLADRPPEGPHRDFGPGVPLPCLEDSTRTTRPRTIASLVATCSARSKVSKWLAEAEGCDPRQEKPPGEGHGLVDDCGSHSAVGLFKERTTGTRSGNSRSFASSFLQPDSVSKLRVPIRNDRPLGTLRDSPAPVDVVPGAEPPLAFEGESCQSRSGRAGRTTRSGGIEP